MPVRCASGLGAACRLFPASGAWRVLLVLIMLAWSACGVRGQEIRIKVLEGRNGRPVANKCVNVWTDPSQRNALLIATDGNGVATLRFVDSRLDIRPGRRTPDCGGLAVADPVVRRTSSIRVTSATGMLCQAHPPNSPWLSFSVRKVLESGDVTANVCGKTEASPRPGELIFFQRPRTLWERLRQ